MAETFRKTERIKSMLKLIIENILFPYVRMAETLDPQICDLESFKPGHYVNKELYLINSYLENISKDSVKNKISHGFLKSWKGYSTITWKWMR